MKPNPTIKAKKKKSFEYFYKQAKCMKQFSKN